MLAGHSRNAASQLPNVPMAINIDGTSSIKPGRLLRALVFNQALPCIMMESFKPCTHFIKLPWPLNAPWFATLNIFILCREVGCRREIPRESSVIKDRDRKRHPKNRLPDLLQTTTSSNSCPFINFVLSLNLAWIQSRGVAQIPTLLQAHLQDEDMCIYFAHIKAYVVGASFTHEVTSPLMPPFLYLITATSMPTAWPVSMAMIFCHLPQPLGWFLCSA